MSTYVINQQQLSATQLNAVAQLEKQEWIEPENLQHTYLKDFRRNLLELCFETGKSKGEEQDSALEAQFDEALIQEEFTPEEIDLVKQYYSQNLASLLKACPVERLRSMGYMPANSLDDEANRRIEIRKEKNRKKDSEIFARVSCWGLRIYKLDEAGMIDDEAEILLPGSLTAIYELTPSGFYLSHIEASNEHLRDLILDEPRDGFCLHASALAAVEHEYNTTIGKLNQGETITQPGSSLQKAVSQFSKETAARKACLDLHKDDPRYIEQVYELTQNMSLVNDAIQRPYHSPTVKRLGEKAKISKGERCQKAKWAMIGVASILVIGVCIAATVFSYGALSYPSLLVGSYAASVTTKAASAVLGVAAIGTLAKATKESTATSEMRQIYTKVSLFGSRTLGVIKSQTQRENQQYNTKQQTILSA